VLLVAQFDVGYPCFRCTCLFFSVSLLLAKPKDGHTEEVLDSPETMQNYGDAEMPGHNVGAQVPAEEETATSEVAVVSFISMLTSLFISLALRDQRWIPPP